MKMEIVLSWTDEYLITSYEVDSHGKAPVTSILRFLQETAYNHAFKLGWGYEQLQENKTFWVLSRILIKMKRYPAWRERIKVHTWGTGVEGLFAYRDFQVLDGQENVIGGASSAWLVLDMERRRPQRLNDTELARMSEHFPSERALGERPGKIRIPSDAQPGRSFPVRYSDLDLYNHVNNAKYVQWVLDGYPSGMLRESVPITLEVNFAAEARMGDEIAIHTKNSESDSPEYFHGIKRVSDNRDVCLVRLEWSTTPSK